VIIADDGSSPQYRHAIDAAVTRPDLDVHVLWSDRNRGRPHTRNRLLRAIESEYVAWLDAGDEWYPSKLERQMEAIASLEAARPGCPVWVTCNYDWVWTGKSPKTCRQETDGDQLRSLLIGSRLRAYLWTLVGTAASFRGVGGFDERLGRMQDLDFFIRFLVQGGTIANVADPAPLCAYHKSDVGRSAAEIRRCSSLIYDKHRAVYDGFGRGFKRKRRYEMERLAWRFALNNANTKLCLYYMCRAFLAHPVFFLRRAAIGKLRP
jgi:glycosyltransferase involved in cell wall biosynthesis